jgi:hypothetical protein
MRLPFFHWPKLFNAAKKSAATGAERPVVASSGFTALDRSINAAVLKASLDVGPVQEVLIPTARVAFPGYSIQVQPPEGETPNETKIDEAIRGLKLADKRVNALKNMRLAWYDATAFRHAFFCYSMTTEDGWTLPETFFHMPADSFAVAPRSIMGNDQYYSDPLIQGYVVDRNDNTEHYYQSQTKTGDPTELDPETVLHIADETAGTASVLAGCVPTIRQWRIAREKAMLGYLQRTAAPNMVATIDPSLLEFTAANLVGVQKEHGVPKEMWDYLKELVQKQSTDTAFLVPPGANVSYPAAGVNPPIETDAYLKREIYTHLIPVSLLDTVGSAISKSSQPALEFFELIASGWREVCAAPFESFYTKLLEENGFEGYECTLEWWPIKQTDEDAAFMKTVTSLKEGMITINEARERAGLSELEETDIAALIDEHLRLQGAAGVM